MQRRAAAAASWFLSHPVEVAFCLLVGIAYAYCMRITGDSFFWIDEWLLIDQGGSLGGLFEPYNQHLSVVILAIYRGLAEIAGFVYTPFRAVGLASLFAVPAAYFLTTRRQLGAPLAALLALSLLWFGSGMSLFPGEMNHHFALLGGIGCAAALNRGPRADWLLAIALAFSLASAGGGVAVAAACLAHTVCVRPHARRWLVVVVPPLLWGLWWLVNVRGEEPPGLELTAGQTVHYVWDLTYAAFDAAAHGRSVIAAMLIAAFVACGAWALSKGLDAGANFVAWSAAMLVWGVGLTTTRGALHNPKPSAIATWPSAFSC